MLRKAVVITTLVILGIVGAVSYMLQLHAFRNMDALAAPVSQSAREPGDGADAGV
jgi:hypothetical protein